MEHAALHQVPTRLPPTEEPINTRTLRCRTPARQDELMTCRLHTPTERFVVPDVSEIDLDEIHLLGDQIRQPESISINYSFLPEAQCTLTPSDTAPIEFSIGCQQLDGTRPGFRDATIDLSNRLISLSLGQIPPTVLNRWERVISRITQIGRADAISELRELPGTDEIDIELFKAFAFGFKGFSGLDAVRRKASQLLEEFQEASRNE